jgi:hypothetical protein
MFAEYFHAAEKHLRSVGRSPEIRGGEPISEARLDAMEGVMRQPFPTELRAYFREMGDGYYFQATEGDDFMVGWLDDFQYNVPGFDESLREDLPAE